MGTGNLQMVDGHKRPLAPKVREILRKGEPSIQQALTACLILFKVSSFPV